jgi:hypothetical protein
MRSAIALHAVSTWHPRCLHAVNGCRSRSLFSYLERSPQAYSRPETVALPGRLQPAYQKVLEEIRVGHHPGVGGDHFQLVSCHYSSVPRREEERGTIAGLALRRSWL